MVSPHAVMNSVLHQLQLSAQWKLTWQELIFRCERGLGWYWIFHKFYSSGLKIMLQVKIIWVESMTEIKSPNDHLHEPRIEMKAWDWPSFQWNFFLDLHQCLPQQDKMGRRWTCWTWARGGSDKHGGVEGNRWGLLKAALISALKEAQRWTHLHLGRDQFGIRLVDVNSGNQDSGKVGSHCTKKPKE